MTRQAKDDMLHQVRGYRNQEQIEELAYMAGAALQTLILMGCPCQNQFEPLRRIMATWVDSFKVTARIS